MEENDPYSGSSEAPGWSLFSAEALLRLPKDYAVLETVWKEPRVNADFADFCLWSGHLQIGLVRLMERRRLPVEWLRDWWSPHHLRFGMLLGYPGPAVSSECWAWAGPDPPREYLTAELPFQRLFDGAEVDYHYARQLSESSLIRTHGALWRQVLTQVYDAFPESELAGIPAFRKEWKAYRRAIEICEPNFDEAV